MKYPQLVSMPSAVSDWLEEQLEARGIDAVVYTRYVLSLLYRDPVDIICPDQDLHFTNPNKEVRRTGGGRKRFCRSSDYWGHAYADTEQLKRSAAVECLKSASDQKCGIESLVDELCEKLKEIKSDSTVISEASSNKSTPEQSSKPSVQDPAKQYYAAFPALSRASPNIITLIPKWFGSPKKRTPRRQNRSSSYEEKLHFKVDSENNMKARSTGKQRFNYFARNKKDFCRNVSKQHDWDFYNNNINNNNNNKKGLLEEEEEMMYDDLPVDIRDLLDSPSPQEDANVDMMNMANMRETGNRKFLQCGTNIISSIWSNDAPMEDATLYDNKYNTSLDEGKESSLLDLKFSSISIDKSVWSSDVNIIKDNETNSFFESCSKRLFDFDGPWSMNKWSDTDSYENDSPVSKSLMKLNHNREESSFTEVKPRMRMFEVNNLEVKKKKIERSNSESGDDLLNSASSHFRPINEKLENRGQYADGTTFVIPNCLEKVSYKRSDSGMYLEADYAMSKKYLEYKKINDDLTLKFNVNQNDKACQTDNDVINFELGKYCEETDFYFPGDQLEEESCTCNSDDNCPVHMQRPDSMISEIFGKFELKCDKCNDNWKNWMPKNEQNIWSGGEVCMACLGLNRPSQERNQLRADITQDGEQLLSDLSSIQKSYMEELPVAEVSCNINELIGAKEWKESAPIHSGSFSFATRLQQDCLLKMATIPTLRSVTL